MTVYVRTQQILVSKKVIANIFANRLPLIFFINFISHPSDCLDEVNPQLFAKIFNVSIYNPFIAIKVILVLCQDLVQVKMRFSSS